MSNNTLIFGKDPTNNNHVLQCSTGGTLFVETGPNSSISIVDPSNDNILSINNDGSINVVGGGGGGGGGLVQIQGNNGTGWENLSSTDNILNTNINNQITNYSLETGGNLEDIKINSDKFKYIGDDLKTVISNTGFDVNNISNTPLITNYSTEIKQDITNEELIKVVDKTGDITGNIYYSDGAQVWADSTPQPQEFPQNPNGWVYVNQNTGNAMNLYYFNGNNETKILSQVVGQYAVVSNLGTKLNNSLIFSIYTKGSPFYTSRVTHSPINGVDMVAGGKYLLYWGAVPDEIYPNLPRLNFTSIITTGPANPNEEVLSVTLNTDSSTPAGDIAIFIESLGVVFNNSGVNQSRILNLLATETEYSNSTNILDKLQSINTGVTIINQITNYANETGGNLEDIKINSDKLKFTGDNLKAVISNTGFDVNNIANVPLITNFSLETGGNLASLVVNSDKLKFTGDNLKTVISNTGFDVNNIANVPLITNFSLETGGNLASLVTNSDKLKFTGDNLKTVISNTAFDVSNIANVPLITNYANETGGNLASIKTNTDKNTYTTGNLNTNITNSSIDTHCFGSNDGIIFHHLKTTISGNLITESKTHDGTNVPITSTLNGAKQSLDVNVSNSPTVNISASQSINIKDSSGATITASGGNLGVSVNNGNTTNNFSRTGISMYPIYPKKRVYVGSGRHQTAVANTVLGATGSNIVIDNLAGFPYFCIGVAQTHFIFLTASSGTRTITLEYISSIDATIKTYSILLSLNTWQQLTPPGNDIACIRGAVGLTTMFQTNTENIRISTTNTNANAYFYWDKFSQQNGIYICPRNCVAYISNVSYIGSQATDILLYKSSQVGFPPNATTLHYTIPYRFYLKSLTTDTNFTAGFDGAIGGTISSGEGIFWMTTGSAPIDKQISFSIVEYFDL